jgi:DNA polymerase-3 subunit epsilon
MGADQQPTPRRGLAAARVPAPADDNAPVCDPAQAIDIAPDTVAVIDFETTGMSPAQGARATEIAVVLLRGDRDVDRYASLMNSGVRVPPFIEQLTGISNRMLQDAPPAAQVMREVADFTRGCVMVAHNAGFDRGFWQHELALAGAAPARDAGFGCTLLLSRRLYPEVPNHRLGTLAQWHGIVPSGRAHRALADAEMAAQLWLRIVGDVQRRYAATVSFGLLQALQRAPRHGLARCVERYFAAA